MSGGQFDSVCLPTRTRASRGGASSCVEVVCAESGKVTAPFLVFTPPVHVRVKLAPRLRATHVKEHVLCGVQDNAGHLNN